MKNELVSVVIPVYNAEKYLKNCINSITAQTYEEIEIIIINDGSSDDSACICNELVKKDKRVKVFHKENGGSTSARKAGMQHVNGKYVAFVDSDDIVKPKMIQEFMRIVHETEADIVVSAFQYFEEREGDKGQNINTIADGLYQKKDLENDIYKKMILNNKNQFGILPCVWGKLFKYDIISKNIEKVDNCIFFGEDAVCTYSSCLDANSIYVTNKSWYIYRKRQDSVTNLRDERLFENNRLVYKHLYQYYLQDREYKEELLTQINQYMKFLNKHAMKKLYGIDLSSFWLFPYDLVDKNNKIVIYGAGSVGKSYYLQLQELEFYEVVLWVDKNKNNELVKSVESIVDCIFDYIVIAISDKNIVQQIRKSLWNMGIDDKKIIWKKPINILLV